MPSRQATSLYELTLVSLHSRLYFCFGFCCLRAQTSCVHTIYNFLVRYEFISYYVLVRLRVHEATFMSCW